MNASELNTASAIYERLNAAADLLQKDGWIQEDYISSHGRCTLGAIFQMQDDARIGEAMRDSDGIAAEAFLSKYLLDAGAVKHPIFTGTHIPSWNDEPGRTGEEVVETLRAAAVIAATPVVAETKEAVHA